MVSKGCTDTTLRLGWEFNGTFFPWAAGGKEASFAAYWREIVDTNARFRASRSFLTGVRLPVLAMPMSKPPIPVTNMLTSLGSMPMTSQPLLLPIRRGAGETSSTAHMGWFGMRPLHKRWASHFPTQNGELLFAKKTIWAEEITPRTSPRCGIGSRRMTLLTPLILKWMQRMATAGL